MSGVGFESPASRRTRALSVTVPRTRGPARRRWQAPWLPRTGIPLSGSFADWFGASSTVVGMRFSEPAGSALRCQPCLALDRQLDVEFSRAGASLASAAYRTSATTAWRWKPPQLSAGGRRRPRRPLVQGGHRGIRRERPAAGGAHRDSFGQGRAERVERPVRLGREVAGVSGRRGQCHEVADRPRCFRWARHRRRDLWAGEKRLHGPRPYRRTPPLGIAEVGDHPIGRDSRAWSRL